MWRNLVFLIFYILLVKFQAFAELHELKCLVCKKIVHQIHETIRNEDQNKKVQVGSFRIQPDGTQRQYQIKYAGSELHLTEILETVCNSMENFAQAKHKETGELELMNLEKDADLLSIYELIPDPDLNRSLKYYCETFIEHYEDEIVPIFKANDQDIDLSGKLCSEIAGYCSVYHSEL